MSKSYSESLHAQEQQSVPHPDCQPAFAMTGHNAAITPALVKEQRDAEGSSSLHLDRHPDALQSWGKIPGLGDR